MLCPSIVAINEAYQAGTLDLIETSGCPWPKATVKSPTLPPALPCKTDKQTDPALPPALP